MKDCWKILSVSLLLASVFWFTGMNIYLGNYIVWMLTLKQFSLVQTVVPSLIFLFVA
ncbi:MAG: hypothetical protein Q4D62_02040 [Planctomycetia bacterium]|nr:hypothetical protein [Planctomycetia bacterium]